MITVDAMEHSMEVRLQPGGGGEGSLWLTHGAVPMLTRPSAQAEWRLGGRGGHANLADAQRVAIW